MKDLPPGTRLQLCSLDYIEGTRPTPEAMQEIHAFAYHLRDHRNAPVKDCRFCAKQNEEKPSVPSSEIPATAPAERESPVPAPATLQELKLYACNGCGIVRAAFRKPEGLCQFPVLVGACWGEYERIEELQNHAHSMNEEKSAAPSSPSGSASEVPTPSELLGTPKLGVGASEVPEELEGLLRGIDAKWHEQIRRAQRCVTAWEKDGHPEWTPPEWHALADVYAALYRADAALRSLREQHDRYERQVADIERTAESWDIPWMHTTT